MTSFLKQHRLNEHRDGFNQVIRGKYTNEKFIFYQSQQQFYCCFYKSLDMSELSIKQQLMCFHAFFLNGFQPGIMESTFIPEHLYTDCIPVNY